MSRKEETLVLTLHTVNNLYSFSFGSNECHGTA